MTLHRFFVDPEHAAGDRFPVPEPIAHQVRTVLRLRDGDRVVLLTGDRRELVCRLEGGECVVEERRASVAEPHHRLAVVQALLKGDGLEDVVQHGTEVGVAEFALVVTERSVVRELSPRRLERLRAIARESAEQSERGLVPPVFAPVPLSELLRPPAVLLLERHEGPRLVDVPPPAAVVIGPEGGFTPGEVEAAREAGVHAVWLGPRVLRSESVAAAAAAVILSRSGDFA